MVPRLLVLAGILLALSPPSVLDAQTTLGRIVGTARDGSGAIVPGATVTVVSAATGEELVATSQEDGAFVFPQVRPGRYTVKLELAGFKSVTYSDVRVEPGQGTRSPQSSTSVICRRSCRSPPASISCTRPRPR